jgi:hypothetical protein
MNDDELEQSNGSPSSYGDSSSDDCPVSPNSSWLNNPNPENIPNGTTLPSNDAWYSSESESGSSFGFGDYPDVQISADCGGFNPL